MARILDSLIMLMVWRLELANSWVGQCLVDWIILSTRDYLNNPFLPYFSHFPFLTSFQSSFHLSPFMASKRLRVVYRNGRFISNDVEAIFYKIKRYCGITISKLFKKISCHSPSQNTLPKSNFFFFSHKPFFLLQPSFWIFCKSHH